MYVSYLLSSLVACRGSQVEQSDLEGTPSTTLVPKICIDCGQNSVINKFLQSAVDRSGRDFGVVGSPKTMEISCGKHFD